MPKQSITTQVMDSLWEFTVSPIGFSIGPYYVCKELKSGKYRFVYFWLPNDAALESAFEIRLISITLSEHTSRVDYVGICFGDSKWLETIKWHMS